VLPGERGTAAEEDEREEARRSLDRLQRALDEPGEDVRRAVQHLPRETPTPPPATG